MANCIESTPLNCYSVLDKNKVSVATKYDTVVKNLRAALAACGSETHIQEAKSLIGRAINSVVSSGEKKATKASMTQKMVEESKQNSQKWWEEIKNGLKKPESQGGE